MSTDRNPRRRFGFIRAKWDLVLFGVGVLALAFGLGVAVERYQLFPHAVIDDATAAVQDWRVNWRHYLQIRSKYLAATTRREGGVTRYDRAAAWQGHTFLTLYGQGGFGAQLIDMEGRVLHRWRIAFSDAFPKQQHLEVTPPDYDVVLHGTALLPTGDVILNMEGVGAVRLDRCSRIVWRLPRMTHHSIDHLPNGETLIAVDRKRFAEDPRYPRLAPGPQGYFMENLIVRLRPDGSVAEEISLLNLLYDSGWAALLFSGEQASIRTEQPTHFNDIEMLREEMAPAFPQFRAGDIMVSLRNLNTILVVDGESRRIKWTMTGPFLYQHDPDFMPNGHILLFDNRRTGGKPRLGYSRIVEIDPQTRAIVWSYQGTDQEPFYTDIRGMQQQLPNGNVLAVEAQQGRVFEIARGSGNRIAWEYVNLVRDGFTGVITGAERVAPEQLTFVGAQCG
ncbi:arylsulfotransferase family protein [Dongia deserti]|uniref:arylsulfotransferase family protein n=1 Tax=Dongia deserti TaxID=2268030 RepID=UPI000E64DAB9|nr:arylsulfotransferase family protein [Dongia deserti]